MMQVFFKLLSALNKWSCILFLAVGFNLFNSTKLFAADKADDEPSEAIEYIFTKLCPAGGNVLLGSYARQNFVEVTPEVKCFPIFPEGEQYRNFKKHLAFVYVDDNSSGFIETFQFSLDNGATWNEACQGGEGFGFLDRCIVSFSDQVTSVQYRFLDSATARSSTTPMRRTLNLSESNCSGAELPPHDRDVFRFYKNPPKGTHEIFVLMLPAVTSLDWDCVTLTEI